MEGESDEKALRILAGKIIPHLSLKLINLKGRGNLLNFNKVSHHVKFACGSDPEINKVLLCVDSECTDFEKTREQVSFIVQSLKQSFPKLPLTYVIVDHSLEGWLLHDREALNKLLGPRTVLPDYGNPEEQCRPVELMEDIFRRNRQEYKETVHASRLAELLDIGTAARASQSFRAFQLAVQG